jgi:hypothetical protein
LNLSSDILVSKFAFKFNLYRYTAKSAAEIAEGLGLTTLQNARHHIVPCTALRAGADEAPDTQVDLGMRWMLEQVGQDWDVLNPRVQVESEAARVKEEELKKERLKKGREAQRERLEQEEREEKERAAKERGEAKKGADLGEAIKKNKSSNNGGGGGGGGSEWTSSPEPSAFTAPPQSPPASGPNAGAGITAFEAPSPDALPPKRMSFGSDGGGGGASEVNPLGAIASPRDLPTLGPRRSGGLEPIASRSGGLQPLPPLPLKNSSV